MKDLAPGFRFYPTEEELVSFYLHNKLEGRRQDIDRAIPVVDIYDYNPWDLPQFAGELCIGDPEQWFFFIPRQEREARGGRPNRLTTEGFWKATGSPGFVYSSNNRIIGGKRTMVFYKGRAPSGRKTQWKMNEYRAAIEAASSTVAPPNLRQEISLCRVYIKSKSQRSFDRRPRPPALLVSTTSACEATAREPLHENEATTSRHQNQPRAAEGTSSLGSSSSADDENPSEAMETGNWNLIDDMEPLWDWDSLKEL